MAEYNGSLHVLIVGAGIGGLSAALALRLQGHRVSVFEKSRFAAEVGAAVHSAPNCTRLLRRLGLEPKEHGATELKGMAFYDGSGVLKFQMSAAEQEGNENQDWYLIHRAHLHEALKNLAVSKEAPGAPVQLRLACRIVDLDCEAATLTLDTSETFSGDFIIGADGVHSWTRTFIAPDIHPYPSGKSCYRWLAPEHQLADHEATREYSSRPGYMYEWITGDRRIYYYPCVNNTVSNMIAFVPTSEVDQSNNLDWNTQARNKDALVDIFSSFGPGPRQVVAQAPESDIKVWELMQMEPLPTWTKGRLVLVGDAAHPFVPYMGQGAAMAIEDGAALAALLPAGTAASQIPAQLRLWQECRRSRVEHILGFSIRNGRDPGNPEFPRPSSDEVVKFLPYCMTHDAWETASNATRQSRAMVH